MAEDRRIVIKAGDEVIEEPVVVSEPETVEVVEPTVEPGVEPVTVPVAEPEPTPEAVREQQLREAAEFAERVERGEVPGALRPTEPGAPVMDIFGPEYWKSLEDVKGKLTIAEQITAYESYLADLAAKADEGGYTLSGKPLTPELAEQTLRAFAGHGPRPRLAAAQPPTAHTHASIASVRNSPTRKLAGS